MDDRPNVTKPESPGDRERLESKAHFRVMSFMFGLRDLFVPRHGLLSEAGIGPGMRVLDYGCGPGSYVSPTAELVGETGRVYALDRHPLALESVRKLIATRHLSNVETILSDCKTGLAENAVDVVLLYDVLHDLTSPTPVLEELRRVLRPEGVLSVSDHHLTDEHVVATVTADRLFRFSRRGQRTYAFIPEKQ